MRTCACLKEDLHRLEQVNNFAVHVLNVAHALDEVGVDSLLLFVKELGRHHLGHVDAFLERHFPILLKS